MKFLLFLKYGKSAIKDNHENTKYLKHEIFFIFVYFRVFASPVKPCFRLTGALSSFRGKTSMDKYGVLFELVLQPFVEFIFT